MKPEQQLNVAGDRWTVVIRSSRGVTLGVWFDVKGTLAAEAIHHVFWHNLSKDKRLLVCEAIAYRQISAAVMHMSPRVDLQLTHYS